MSGVIERGCWGTDEGDARDDVAEEALGGGGSTLSGICLLSVIWMRRYRLFPPVVSDTTGALALPAGVSVLRCLSPRIAGALAGIDGGAAELADGVAMGVAVLLCGVSA